MPLVVAGIMAGVEIYQAHKAGDAAQEAAGIQTKAGQQALGKLDQTYQQARQDFAPYREAGQRAAATLGALTTPQGSPGAYQPGKDYSPGAMNGPGQTQAFFPPPNPNSLSALGQAQPPQVPRMGGPGAIGSHFGAPMSSPQAPMGQVGPQSGGADQMVTMQGPDGSTTQMPLSRAQQYLGKPGFSRIA